MRRSREFRSPQTRSQNALANVFAKSGNLETSENDDNPSKNKMGLNYVNKAKEDETAEDQIARFMNE